jgi:hypothetical protein
MSWDQALSTQVEQPFRVNTAPSIEFTHFFVLEFNQFINQAFPNLSSKYKSAPSPTKPISFSSFSTYQSLLVGSACPGGGVLALQSNLPPDHYTLFMFISIFMHYLSYYSY